MDSRIRCATAVLVLHQERSAREPGICQPLTRNAGCLFQLSKQSKGVVYFALVVGNLSFSGEDSGELELGIEGVGIARIPGEELLDGLPSGGGGGFSPGGLPHRALPVSSSVPASSDRI